MRMLRADKPSVYILDGTEKREKREKEKDSRYIQKASAPVIGPYIRPVTSCTSVTIPVTIWKLGRTVCVYSMVQRREKEKDTRYIQEASAPAAELCIRPVTSCTSVTIPSKYIPSDVLCTWIGITWYPIAIPPPANGDRTPILARKWDGFLTGFPSLFHPVVQRFVFITILDPNEVISTAEVQPCEYSGITHMVKYLRDQWKGIPDLHPCFIERTLVDAKS